MTQPTTLHETSASLLAPMAHGLMRRIPEILSLSIHDTNGYALWSSSDFLLAEDHALIAEVVEDPHDVRGRSDGLWWESADTARARCALPAFDIDQQFAGVILVVYGGVTSGDEDRAARVMALEPLLPVLGKSIQCIGGGAMPRGESVETYEREERLLDLIDGALRNDEFALHLQPIVSLREDDETPLIVEVLIRLPTEDFGVLVSHEFLETAERHGRMPAIDRWVIRALLVWMQRNRDRWADANAVFSVNLSGKSVVRPDFRAYLENCLDKSGLPLTALRFEVAELDAGIAPQEFAALARSLAERGCEVSVDNAGTGTGRYDFLRDATATHLKIDGSLVQGVPEDRVSRAVINGLVHMADTLGMRTVASHIDTTSKLRAVTSLGVDYVQGFRLRKPEDIDTFDFLNCGCQRTPLPPAA